MNYMNKHGLVKKAGKEKVEVSVAQPHEGSSSACIGCGRCSKSPDADIYMIDNPDRIEVKKGDHVVVALPEFPFLVNIFMIFLLPLLLMVVIPVLGMVIGNRLHLDIFNDIRMIVIEGLAGLLLAGGVNVLLSRSLQKNYPCVIRETLTKERE